MEGEKLLDTLSYADYLSLQDEAGTKFEYHDGFVTAMAGGSPEHGLIAMNVGAEVRLALRASKKSCRVFSSDVRIRVEATNRTFYPDLSVVCGEVVRSEADGQALSNPILLVEVYTDATLSLDWSLKFAHYRQIPSLREYVLVSASTTLVNRYSRTEADGPWEIQTALDPGEVIPLKSLGIELAVADIYAQVEGLREEG